MRATAQTLRYTILVAAIALLCVAEARAAAVATPAFSVGRGYYDQPFDVAISTATAGASIRYTTDGTWPTEAYGVLLETGQTVPITVTTCLRAVAYKEGMSLSESVTHTYFLSEAGQTAGVAATSLPRLSLSMSSSDFWAINGEEADGSVAEKPVSVEFLGNRNWQVNCAIRCHSHQGRTKRAFRLLFKSGYGPTQLDHPIFEQAPLHATSKTGFDKLILRSGYNEHFASTWPTVTYCRDEWARATQLDMNGLGARGIFVDMYVNGSYWGLYNICERPDHAHMALWHGGSKGDWYSGHHAGDISGNDDRYDKAVSLAKTGDYSTLKDYMDMNVFFDYLMLAWYDGHRDWPRNNFYYANRNSPAGKVQWITWDGEFIWDMANDTPYGAWVHFEFVPGYNSTHVLPKMWHGLRGNWQFIEDFSRRVDYQCYSGALRESECLARWDAIVDNVELGIQAEIDKWGSEGSINHTYSKWNDSARNWIPGQMQGNVNRFINALKEYGYYHEPSNPPPSAPSNLAASALDSSRIRVTWTDNSGNESGFKLDRRVSGADTWARVATPGANVTTYTNSGLADGTTFYFKVKAYNGDGDSGYSNVDDATTPVDLQPPAAPSSPAAAALSSSEIRFTWQDNSNNEESFKIRRSLDGSDWYALASITVSANTTSYTDAGLAANTKYWYKVRAGNAAGDSAYSAAASATTQQAAPSAPSSLAASALDSSRIRVTWQDNSGSESGFKLDRRQTGTSIWERPATLAANATTYTDGGLPADTTFYYKVKAYNGGGNSDYSNVDGAKTQPVPTPAIAVSTTSIAVSCEEGTDAADTTFQVWNGDAATLTYNVVESSSKLDVSPISGTSTGSSDKQTHTVTFHTADMAVGAYDRSISVEDDGSGAANGPITIAVEITVTARPLDPPAAPSAVTATALSASELAVSWQDNSENETGFKLDRRQTMTDTWVQVGTLAADATTYTDSGLVDDTTFYYKVKAYNADGDSAYSEAVGAKTEPALQPPAMPGNPTATALSTTEILFTWQDNSDVEESLLLRRSLDGVDFYALPATVIPADATSYTDTGLSPDTEYWYKIKARNAAGESAYTAPTSATTEPEPQPAMPFAAYNDLAWAEGQRSANITMYTRGEGGALKNHADGATLGATLTVNMGGDFTGPEMGAEPTAGTDAANVFGGIVDCLGLISYGATDLTLTFSGLDPAQLYEVVVFGNRNNPDYTDRITKNAISGADTFVNASSAGTDFSGPSDTSTAVVNGYNTQNGHVARFIDVVPGTDGEFVVRVYDNESPAQPKFYVSAVMLRGYELAQADSDGDGLSDGEEYVMGTSAENPDEYLAVRLGLVAGQLTASFDTIVAEGAGYEGKTRYYALERCTDIAAGTWTAVSGYDRIQGTGQAQDCVLADPEPAAVFRARVWLE